MNCVKKLKDSVAKKIAAGEVIDRPYSVVRELLDNSIDSNATDISLYLEDGGITSIRIVDNGEGMTKDDLYLCYLPHATSKIETEDDLLTLKSLGFRGEALSSISTCTKLSITSRKINSNESNRLVVHGGEFISLEETTSSNGTIITAQDLFYSIPARRKFLKKPSGEVTLCKNTFLEKALPFPEINFKLYKDNQLEIFLPKSNLKDRVINGFKGKFNPSFLGEISTTGPGFTITAVLGRPELHRKDKKYMQVYTNKRRITEYAFIQGIQYGYNEVLPGGNYPIAFIFIDVDPALIDFNIHPAKKEAKFRNLQTIHHSLVELIKEYLKQYRYNLSSQKQDSVPLIKDLFKDKFLVDAHPSNPPVNYYKKDMFSDFKPKVNQATAYNYIKEESTGFKVENKSEITFRYLGQIMDVFLLAEKNNTLYIIDQHATHEIILYNKIANSKVETQDLLLPITFDVTEEEENLILENMDEYKAIGFKIQKKDSDLYEITALPSYCNLLDSEIINFITRKKGNKDDIQRDLYSTLACRSAVKEGDTIDPIAARELIEAAFNIDQARCPHGRPIWFELSKRELYELVGRI